MLRVVSILCLFMVVACGPKPPVSNEAKIDRAESYEEDEERLLDGSVDSSTESDRSSAKGLSLAGSNWENCTLLLQIGKNDIAQIKSQLQITLPSSIWIKSSFEFIPGKVMLTSKFYKSNSDQGCDDVLTHQEKNNFGRLFAAIDDYKQNKQVDAGMEAQFEKSRKVLNATYDTLASEFSYEVESVNTSKNVSHLNLLADTNKKDNIYTFIKKEGNNKLKMIKWCRVIDRERGFCDEIAGNRKVKFSTFPDDHIIFKRIDSR